MKECYQSGITKSEEEMMFNMNEKYLQQWINDFGDFIIANNDDFIQMASRIELLREYGTIYPSQDNLYNAFKYFTPKDTKVVILGQDPYHNEGQANGLAFSVNKNNKLPPSLKNIFKELQDDLGGELRTDGDLSDWAKQGVLLLNTSLSVREGEPNSMQYIWYEFTREMIQFISKSEKPVIFVLWGKSAQWFKQYINFEERHYIISSPHPSPLSARKGFFGSKPFSYINKTLIETYQKPIDWFGSKKE